MSELCTRNTNLVRSLERDSKCCECLTRDDNVITVHLLPIPSYTAHYWDLIEFLEIPTPTCYRERYNITTSNLLTPGPPCTWSKVDTRVNLRAMQQPNSTSPCIQCMCFRASVHRQREKSDMLFIYNEYACSCEESSKRFTIHIDCENKIFLKFNLVL